jgi:hypothetical protein
MPQLKGHIKLFGDWDNLIGACLQNADRLAGMEPLLTALVDLFAQARTTKVEQDQQQGLRKVKTQSLDLTLDRGKEAARKLRRFVLTRYDSRDEQLTQYGITPNRTRVRRTAAASPKPVLEAAKPAQETASAPASTEETTTGKPAAEPAK